MIVGRVVLNLQKFGENRKLIVIGRNHRVQQRSERTASLMIVGRVGHNLQKFGEDRGAVTHRT